MLLRQSAPDDLPGRGPGRVPGAGPDGAGDGVSVDRGHGLASSGHDAIFVASFAEFYRIHHGRIAGALALTFGDAELGREATDEAMTRAFDHWGTVSGHTNPAGWVYRVGLNWGRSWFRKAARRLPWVESTVTELPETADPALREALAALDDKYRAVVVCRYFLDWSTERTAAALDLPTGTVKSRLHHALGRLRAQLDDDDPISDDPTSRGTSR